MVRVQAALAAKGHSNVDGSMERRTATAHLDFDWENHGQEEQTAAIST
jgi:hypothetical protein